jgi:uncharacterized oligopeptide transporter (OPT) family protein
MPALICLGFDLEATRIFALALFEEHDTLIYPEGKACANVLMAGERGGSIASRVLGLGGIYTLFQNSPDHANGQNSR